MRSISSRCRMSENIWVLYPPALYPFDTLA